MSDIVCVNKSLISLRDSVCEIYCIQVRPIFPIKSMIRGGSW
jgi:hypothetical protein